MALLELFQGLGSISEERHGNHVQWSGAWFRLICFSDRWCFLTCSAGQNGFEMEKYKSELACNPKLICNAPCWNTNTLCMRDSSVIIWWSLVSFLKVGIWCELISGWGGDKYNMVVHFGLMPDSDFLQIWAETCFVKALSDSRARNMSTAIIESNYICDFTGKSLTLNTEHDILDLLWTSLQCKHWANL